MAQHELRDGAPVYGNYINGEWVHTDATFEVRNPANREEIVAHMAVGGPADVTTAVDAAAEAFKTWSRTGALERANILYKAADLLVQRSAEIGRVLTREEGKTIKEGVGEALRAANIMRYYAGETLQPNGDHYPSANPKTMLYSVREPLGVVGLITPWNFPIAIPVWKTAPAIAFGNTVVFKPASAAPVCAMLMAEILEDAGLPKGVVNVVTGPAGGVGNALVDDPRVAAISFTGSGVVGNRIRIKAANRGAKVQLELGGKNPAIVLADADMTQAVQQVVAGAMNSTGQKCTATSRAIVDRRIAAEFTDLLQQRLSTLVVGDPLDEATQMGPLIDDASADRLMKEIAAAKETDAQHVMGGDRPDELAQGAFVTPTLFTNVSSDSRMGQEEYFGPLLGVIPVDDMDEAMDVANSVKYGLSASIFTRDLGKAMRFAREIQAGMVHINSETAGAEYQLPFGGYKGSSSYSREQGKAAVEFYTQTKTVFMDEPLA
ncbi:MAG: aldehyde dehydrogenase family protein [Thermomicrobiales bacterium]|nr:aldehyde dehydrogenase family protein [Thermomicrobiales bacterium]